MATPDQIAANPEWLPNQFDARRRKVQFVRFTRATLEDRAFLANQQGEAEVWLPTAAVKAMCPAAGLPRFIFHSGFCRSTLLLQALCGSGRMLGLNEPEILNSLARMPEPDEALVGSVVALLMRPHRDGEGIIVKPSNFPNRLIPIILRAHPQVQAVILTNGLENYLRAVARKGLLGRQWGRQVLLSAATYAGDIRSLSQQITGLTDLQVAGLGWLLMQNWFDRVRVPEVEGRLAVCHGESLTTHGPAALAAAAAHLHFDLAPEEIAAIVAGPVFTQDAKTGEDYARLQARNAARAEVPVIADEIAEVAQWIGELAAVSGLTVPAAQTLGLASAPSSDAGS